MYSPKEVSAYTLCYCSAAHLRDIFINQKILPLDKLINQQEGILAHKYEGIQCSYIWAHIWRYTVLIHMSSHMKVYSAHTYWLISKLLLTIIETIIDYYWNYYWLLLKLLLTIIETTIDYYWNQHWLISKLLDKALLLSPKVTLLVLYFQFNSSRLF